MQDFYINQRTKIVSDPSFSDKSNIYNLVNMFCYDARDYECYDCILYNDGDFICSSPSDTLEVLLERFPELPSIYPECFI